MKKKLFLIIIAIIAISLLMAAIFFNHQRYIRYVRLLTTITSQRVNKVIIYPRVGVPAKESFTFHSSDPMIHDFFASLIDLRSYSPNRDMVASAEHIWFIEIVTNSETLQISFDIPYGKGNIVVGTFGHFGTSYSAYYGSFQSRQLYQWYQTYSHRWLTPEGTPPAPPP